MPHTSPTAAPSPHPTWTDLTAFEGNVLYAIARLEREDVLTYGLAIRDFLGEYYNKAINHGRLYPTLDDLTDQGLITKTSVDDRTNEYELTDAGYELLRSRRDDLAAVLTEADK
ncbi:PadR family transcriptional regulator [Halobaculum rubrum]|uniref:PadR family transcriptional regulator n=1 Tax=Halobaculum rubrum TaxID=2872158 RepID=UPI001CA40179|nr:PadR family transcriptional regulator [Halobaculum rubrum]QZY01220.1 PadR family transcriptional regulator [Halobaculum rubrum]